MQRSIFLGAAALAALTTILSGCFLVTDDEPPPPPSTGTLTVLYTIEGTTYPVMCDVFDATDAELVVYDLVGAVVTEKYAPCEAFGVSVSLFDGAYDADLTLVDPFDNARSVTKPLSDLDVLPRKELVVNVDFPVGSRL